MQHYKAACAVVCLSAVGWPSPQPQQADTQAKPLTEKAAKARAKSRLKELTSGYDIWLNQDVAYIITDEERRAFRALQNDEEREQFIEQFWLRRDPSPDTEENEYKEEHYRRIAYANERFASGVPGWRTDRGRIYVTFGPPDEIDDHSSGGTYQRPPEEGGGTTSAFPFQRWRYRHIDGIGEDIVLLFVDPSMSGEFRLTSDPSEIDALLNVPGAGLSLTEQLGLSDKTQRFNRPDGTHLPMAFGALPESMNEFTRIDLMAKVLRPPALKFPDLESVTTLIRYNQLPMQVRVDYLPVTEASAMAVITLQFRNSDLQYQAKDGGQQAHLEISGRIETMSHHRVIPPFEEDAIVFSPQPMFSEFLKGKRIYQKIVPLRPGSYRLIVTVKDAVAGNYATSTQAMPVPRLDPERLSASSLIVADLIEPVGIRRIASGPFILGDQRVHPRVDGVFHPDERVGFYVNLYNFAADPATHKLSAEVTYELSRAASGEVVARSTGEAGRFPHASPSQVTVEEFLNLKDLALPPGTYKLTVRAHDRISGQTTEAASNVIVSASNQ